MFDAQKVQVLCHQASASNRRFAAARPRNQSAAHDKAIAAAQFPLRIPDAFDLQVRANHMIHCPDTQLVVGLAPSPFGDILF